MCPSQQPMGEDRLPPFGRGEPGIPENQRLSPPCQEGLSGPGAPIQSVPGGHRSPASVPATPSTWGWIFSLSHSALSDLQTFALRPTYFPRGHRVSLTPANPDKRLRARGPGIKLEGPSAQPPISSCRVSLALSLLQRYNY